jgi:hypothetical protein
MEKSTLMIALGALVVLAVFIATIVGGGSARP